MVTSLLLTGSLLAWAPPPTAPDPATTTTPEELGRTRRPGKDLTFFGYFFTRAEMTNVSPENDLFKGQIVGRLFGPNTTRTSKDRAVFLEQRFIPFFIYEPKVLSRHARIRASFEIDWTYGDVNNSAGGNFGSAFTADQVNLQTQNVEAEFDVPGTKHWYVDLGLQRLYDTALDPYRTVFEHMTLTGTRLNFWGSDAVGVTVHGLAGGQKIKLGAYQLYENLIQKDDDVALFEAATDRHLGRGVHVGGHVRYLRDASSGAGGVGLLGQGPASPLAGYTGAFRVPIPGGIESYRSHFVWTGADASYNPLLTAGWWGASAYVVGNFGRMLAEDPERPDHYDELFKVRGVAANARVALRYGRTPHDMVSLESAYTSGDADGITDGVYNGVITGNTWGAPGALMTSHGAYLLMPHAYVVNRFYAAVTDPSNLGFGLWSANLNASYDIVPNKLEVKVGGAVARSNIKPLAGERFIGGELNGRITWRLRPLVAIEAHAAHLWLGGFFRSPEVLSASSDEDLAAGTPQALPRNPWTAFLSLRWLMV
ncbi:MAG: hypothetical protein H6712_00125 [Myxococcales bacterium]|nr:hypothetical protein [Myxococcales bacterium]MCB9712230.1 hypothetical protein [Myxococcales bacterium]